MLRRFLAVAALAGLTAPMLAQDAPKTTIPAKKDPTRHQAFLEDIQKKQGMIDTVFLGDSITDGWRGKGAKVWKEELHKFNPINLGIGGDRTQHVLWRV